MATALRPLQTAVFGKLNAHPLLTGRVFTKTPEPAAFPCVTIGSITETPNDSHDAQGLESLVTVHVWSKASSQGEAYDYFAAVDAALDRVPFAVAGFTEAQIKHAQHQTVPDPDPDVVHINAQYQAHMKKE